jgi:predicted GTPase
VSKELQSVQTPGRVRVLIMGAAGRDFHNFNMCFRDDPTYEVVAFTATQIPDIAGRCYPPELAGPLYRRGIPIEPEDRLEDLILSHAVRQVIFSYSDVSHDYVMHRASAVLATGADFRMLGPDATMLHANVPVVAITAVRTGSGKSQTTRRVARLLKAMGRRTVVVRHPMPYGDLTEQVCQRFASYGDLESHKCTIEEREEYEPHLDNGDVVYAGVDYAVILAQAQAEADVILWDGGNNDLPFFRPDLHVVVVDPLRPGHELGYHPGEANLRRADVVVINKTDSASPDSITVVRRNIQDVNPHAVVVDAASPLFVEGGEQIRGKRVLVIEDGPTVTHGEMSYGAGAVAARKFGAAAIVDPRPYAVGSIAQTFIKYPRTGQVLPAMGYGAQQVADLEATIRSADCDLVIIATPIDLRRLIGLDKPSVRVRYELQEIGKPDLEDVLRMRFGQA